MSSQHHRDRILRALTVRPHNIRAFTDGEMVLQVAPKHVLNWLVDMQAEGLVRYLDSDEWEITQAGRAKLRERTTIASPRENPLNGPLWKPAPWVPARAGANDHLRCGRVGIDAGSSSVSKESE
jgi:hypothetical protein